jgi:hypothetical protein
LPADTDKLWRLAKAKSKKAFERDSGLVLADFEELEVNGERMLRNRRMAAQYANTLEDWMKKKEAGEASKAARLARHSEQPSETVVPAPSPIVQ